MRLLPRLALAALASALPAAPLPAQAADSTLALVALGFCFVMDLWEESMETIALVTVSVAISVVVAVPLGILAARRPRLEAALRPILDIMQTVPPWVYLIPAVIIFSLGQVPAIMATPVFSTWRSIWPST